MYGCITTGLFPWLGVAGKNSENDFLSVNDTVMSEQKQNKVKWLHLRLTETEYKKIKSGFARSTKRKLSEYARNILLDKPITVYTRNQSYDDFVAEIILLKAELKAIGNNLNQAVKKLHTMDTDPEIKTWAIIHENSKHIFFKKVEEIQQKIIQIQQQWSQE